MSNASPARDAAGKLLDEQRRTGFDRDADHELALGREQCCEQVELGVPVDDVLQHFHAEPAVVPPGMFAVADRLDCRQFQPRIRAISVLAIFDVLTDGLYSDGLRRRMRSAHRETEKRSVAAPKIENPLASELRGECKGRFESAPVTPRDKLVVAEDLFDGVMAAGISVPDVHYAGTGLGRMARAF